MWTGLIVEERLILGGLIMYAVWRLVRSLDN